MELPFARAMEAGEVLKLRDLNSGFQNPRTISLAYYEASLLVEHIVAQFGEPKLRALVQSFADGIDTEAAIKKVLSTDIDALQIVLRRASSTSASRAAPRADAPDGFAARPARRQAQARPRRPIRRAIAVQMALGRALRRTDPAGGDSGVRAGGGSSCRWSPAPESAYMQIVEVALAARRQGARPPRRSKR